MKATLPPETLITVIRSDRACDMTKPVHATFYRGGHRRFDDWHTAQGAVSVNAFLAEPFAEFPIGTPVFRTYSRDGVPVNACHVVRDGLS